MTGKRPSLEGLAVSSGKLGDSRSAFLQKVVEAFPDGPPSEEMAIATLQANIHLALTQMGEERVGEGTVQVLADTDATYELALPEGLNILMTKHGKTWALIITSPPSPNGKTLSVTQTITADKGRAIIALEEYVEAMSDIYLGMTLMAKEQKATGKVEGMNKMMEVLEYPYEHVFDEIYSQFNTMARQKLGIVDKRAGFFRSMAKLNKDYARNLTSGEMVITAAMVAHVLWKQTQDRVFSEEMELAMAKNNGEHLWWTITGGKKPMNRLINILQSNRHFIVLLNDETCYLRMQKSELSFINGLASEYNCRAKLSDEPSYGETPCGKRHGNPSYHERKCNACIRVKANLVAAEKAAEAREAAATLEQAETDAKAARTEAQSQNMAALAVEPVRPTTTSPDGKFTSGIGTMLPRNPVIPPRNDKRAEEAEWAAKSGEVIVVQGATTGIDPMDFEALAVDYRRVAERLLARASWYEETADKYEALLRPSDAVREAEAALEAAKANEESDRDAKVAALVALMQKGPPEAS
tara:strand:+ start:77 stop:1654 length:1578 start_codon:yes stop_codon:yes gene_type:complete